VLGDLEAGRHVGAGIDVADLEAFGDVPRDQAVDVRHTLVDRGRHRYFPPNRERMLELGNSYREPCGVEARDNARRQVSTAADKNRMRAEKHYWPTSRLRYLSSRPRLLLANAR
jgi:hypothetical protein